MLHLDRRRDMDFISLPSETEPLFMTALVVLLPWPVLYILWTLLRATSKSFGPALSTSSTACKSLMCDVYEDITPLSQFNWQSTTPPNILHLKSKYHLTMGLQQMTFSDLIAVDNTYLDRITLRRDIMAKHASVTLACNPVAAPAVQELHSWMFGVYLPRRYPTMFQILPRGEKEGWSTTTRNLVTNENMLSDEPSAITALHNLGAHVDTDFLLLLPSSSKDGQPIYHLEAFVTCFPSGFSTLAKLSMPLADIHKPVPGYASKLERSMDRYFAKIERGTIVKRANWTVTTTDALFIESGTHFHNGAEASDKAVQEQKQEVDLERCRVRAERQTLHRLPKTGALVFAFKTYQYRLEQIKAAGMGPALAEAIKGLATGSVPEMHFYKRGVIWGDIVAQYLRQGES